MTDISRYDQFYLDLSINR